MTPEIALLLIQDGISTGAIYVLVGLGIVLIFLVLLTLSIAAPKVAQDLRRDQDSQDDLHQHDRQPDQR